MTGNCRRRSAIAWPLHRGSVCLLTFLQAVDIVDRELSVKNSTRYVSSANVKSTDCSNDNMQLEHQQLKRQLPFLSTLLQESASDRYTQI